MLKIVLLVFGLLQFPNVFSQGLEKYEAKLIVTFINNIEWENSESISIGVLGNSKILTALSNHMKEKKLKHTVNKINFLEESTKYEMVVLPAGSPANIPDLLEIIGEKKILVLAEEKKLSNQELDICFVEEEGKLRFVINETNAKRKGIVMSNKLLDYASEIR
ncbi:MAG: YfiR family protein [Reichenbachiella sp.]